MHDPFNNVSEKEKYKSNTIARLTLFTRAFCQTRVQSLLKGSFDAIIFYVY